MMGGKEPVSWQYGPPAFIEHLLCADTKLGAGAIGSKLNMVLPEEELRGSWRGSRREKSTDPFV